MSIDEWNDDSILSRNGYAADGSQSDLRRQIILNRIINKYQDDADSLLAVIRRLRDLAITGVEDYT